MLFILPISPPAYLTAGARGGLIIASTFVAVLAIPRMMRFFYEMAVWRDLHLASPLLETRR